MTTFDQIKIRAQLVAELDDLRTQMAGMREGDEPYHRLVQLFPDAVWVAQRGTIVYVNDAAAKLFRAAGPEKLIGRKPH